jgi:ABC-type phosphate transport system permease subunit
MKIKLQKVFIVCLIILTMFSPSLFTFSIIWQQHLELIHLLNFDQYNLNHNSSISIVSLFQQPNILICIQWLLFAIPISLVAMLFLHRRYLTHRATTHQKNVDILEQLYQQNINR